MDIGHMPTPRVIGRPDHCFHPTPTRAGEVVHRRPVGTPGSGGAR